MPQTKATTEQMQESRDTLAVLTPGDTIYTILRHVSKSGMLRTVGVFCMEGGQPREITAHVGRLTGLTLDRDRWGVRVHGCGTDVGFEVTYELGRALYPEGVPCAGESCVSNDHSNGDRDRSGHTTHGDGGYAFRHRWL